MPAPLSHPRLDFFIEVGIFLLRHFIEKSLTLGESKLRKFLHEAEGGGKGAAALFSGFLRSLILYRSLVGPAVLGQIRKSAINKHLRVRPELDRK